MNSNEYEVFALEYGRTMDQPVGVALYGAYNEGVAPMPYGFVAARSSERIVLVDIGFEATGSGEHMRTKFRVDPYVSPLTVLKKIGIAAGEVTDVILTHAHYDHMGSLTSFPNARFYLQQKELEDWKWALAKGTPFANITAACNPDDVATADDLVKTGRMELLDGNVEDVVPGISVRTAPQSHSYMLQFAVIEQTSKGRMIAAGDGAFSRGNFPNESNGHGFVPLGFGVGSQTGMVLGLEQLWELSSHDLERVIIVHEEATYRGNDVTVAEQGMRVSRLA